MTQSIHPAPLSEPHRDGMMFVVSPDSALPCRCIKCNADCPGPRVFRRISTLSAWYPLFSSAGWNAHCPNDRPIYVPFTLCLRHRAQWLARLMLIGLALLTNIFCFIALKASATATPTMDILATVLPALFLLTSLTLRPILRPRRVHHGLAWFAGAGEAFLESLPELDAQPTPILEAAAA